eukprot:107246_1
MGSADFTDFLTGFFIDIIMIVVETMYFEPLLGFVFALIEEAYTWIKQIFGMELDEPEEEEEEMEIEASGTLEELMGAFNTHATGLMGLWYTPIFMLLLLMFRDEVQLPILYGIKEADMIFYFLFAFFIIPSSIITEVFLINTQELIFGWKIYDYLAYCDYRYKNRSTRWTLHEPNMDLSVEQSERSLHQMCFSSQYYFACILHQSGIVMAMLSFESMIKHSYNPFGDIMTPFLFFGVTFLYYLVSTLTIEISNMFGLWRLRMKRYSTKDEVENYLQRKGISVPDWEKAAAGEDDEELQKQMQLIDISDLIDETFKYDFLSANRDWVVDQLRAIMTPRNLRKGKTYVMSQLGRILHQDIRDDISEESSSASEDHFAMKPFIMPNMSTETIAFGWLEFARRRKEMKTIANEIIDGCLKDKCQSCPIEVGLVCRADTPVLNMVNEYCEQHEWNLDVKHWTQHCQENLRATTICEECAASEALFPEIVKVGDISAKILHMMLSKARESLEKKRLKDIEEQALVPSISTDTSTESGDSISSDLTSSEDIKSEIDQKHPSISSAESSREASSKSPDEGNQLQPSTVEADLSSSYIETSTEESLSVRDIPDRSLHLLNAWIKVSKWITE